MGAIARSGLKRAVIGNTAEKILDPLAYNVLVIKPRYLAGHARSIQRGAHYVSVPNSPLGVTL